MLIYSVAGELILGSRFKRLSDKYLASVAQIYKQQQINFEPSWFSIFYVLDRYESISITDMAQLLDLTQSAVSQMVSSLEAKGLVKTQASNVDRRVKTVALTDKGKDILSSVKPIWKLIKSKMRQMLDEGESSKFLLEALDELEGAFQRKPLHDRVLDSIMESGHFFVRYRDVYYLSLKKLVFDWMFKFGCPSDRLVNDFYGFIQDNATKTLIAVKEREVMACVIGYFNEDFECIVCDRDDVDNRVVYSLLSRFFEIVEEPKRIFFDGDKPMILKLLKDKGFSNVRIVEKPDVNKRLAIVERPNGTV